MSLTDNEKLELAMLMKETCRKCGGKMVPGKAIAQTWEGSPDFPGQKNITMWPGGPGEPINCMKCEKCGWSVTV